MPQMSMEVIVDFADRLSGPARAAAESLNTIKTSAEGLAGIGESFTRATAGLRNAGTIFKNAGEGAEQLAGHLRVLDGVNVAPKITALAEAERLSGLGGRLRTVGTGAADMAVGLKAVDAINAEHIGVIAGAVERLSKASGERNPGKEMGSMGNGLEKAAGSADHLVTALSEVQAKLSAIAAAGTIEPLRAPSSGIGRTSGQARAGAGESAGGSQAQAGTSGASEPETASAAPGMNLSGTRYDPRQRHGWVEGIKNSIRHHAMNSIAMAVTPMPHGNIYGAAGHFFEEGGDLDAALATMKMNGIATADIGDTLTLAQDVSRRVPQTTIAQNVRGIMEARLALSGNLQGAQRFYETAAKAGQVVGFAQHDVSSGAKFSDSIYDMLRAGELANYVSDPAKLNSFIEGATRTAVYSQGKVFPKSYHMTAVYLRGALQGLSEDFYTNQLPFLMQELQTGKGAGGQAGSAIAQMAQTVSRATIAKKDVPEWVRLGLADGSKVDSKGILSSDGVVNRRMQQENPFDYAGFINDQLIAHGCTSKEDKLSEINLISGNQKFKQALEILVLQADRMREFTAHQAEVGSIDSNYATISNTYQGSLDALKGQAGSFAQTAGGYVQGLAIGSLQAGTRFMSGLTGDLGGGGTGTDPTPPPTGSPALPIIHGGTNLTDFSSKAAGALRLGSAAIESPIVTLMGKIAAGMTAPIATGLATAAGPLLSRVPGAGAVAELFPWLARMRVAANPWLTAAWAAGQFGSFMATPNTLGRGEGFDDARNRAIDAAALAKRQGVDYANAGPDILPAYHPAVKAPDPVTPPAVIKLPDATPAGATAGGQIAAGVASAAGAVAAQAEALMSKIRAILGGGVNVPVNLQTGGLPGVGGQANDKHAALSPVVRGSVTGQHVASIDSSSVVNNHQKTTVIVHVADNSGNPKETAKAVHEEFRKAGRSQLSDGVLT